MPDFHPGTVAEASLAIVVELMKALVAKGLMTDAEVHGVLTGAVYAHADNPDGAAVGAVIRTLIKGG